MAPTKTTSAAPQKTTRSAAPATKPAPVVAPAPVPAPAPVVDKVEATAAAASAAAPAQPPLPVDVIVNTRFEVLNQKVADLSNTLKDLQVFLKNVQKEIVKLAKTSSKRTRTRNPANGDKKTPSGFAKPTKLSNELCDFLGVEQGTELARTDVTRRLNLYIKANHLQDEADKRKIHPDAKLGSVLSLKQGDNLTFFNLQSFIKHNFIKAVV